MMPRQQMHVPPPARHEPPRFAPPPGMRLSTPEILQQMTQPVPQAPVVNAPPAPVDRSAQAGQRFDRFL